LRGVRGGKRGLIAKISGASFGHFYFWDIGGMGVRDFGGGASGVLDRRAELSEYPGGSLSIIGEVRVCGRDFRISDLYGPTVEDWTGELEFRNWELGK